MKTATVTWYHYDNFGTALQAYALQNVLHKLGYNNQIINYQGQDIYQGEEKGKSVHFVIRNFRRLIKRIYRLKYAKFEKEFERLNEERSSIFRKFVSEYLSLSRPCCTYEEFVEIEKEYDTFLCGSDQIWSPSVFNPLYFLSFVSDARKKIAYAPSFGNSTIQDEVREEIRKYVNRIDHLSVREQLGSKLIKELTGREASVVLDPTLLLDDKEWEEVASLPVKDRKYILCYFLGNATLPHRFIKMLKKHYPYEVIIISTKKDDLTKPGTHIVNIGLLVLLVQVTL